MMRPTFAASPAEAIVEHLGLAGGRTPASIVELSERRQRELREAPRYACPCCGYLTLLNLGRYEICAVCRWEDDPAVERDGPDVVICAGRPDFVTACGRGGGARVSSPSLG